MNTTESTIRPDGGGGQGGEALTEHLNFFIGAVFTPIVCVLGMAGNGVAALVWNRPVFKGATGRFLSAQSIADFGVLLLSLFVVSSLQWEPDLKLSQDYATFYSYVGLPLYYMCVHCSVWLTLGVTVDRYILVCWIGKATKLRRENQANMGIAIIIFSSVLANIPHFMIYQCVTPDEEGGAALVKTDFADSTGGKVYALWVSCISLIVIPWCCVLFMNLAIIRTIKESNRKMNEKKSRNSVRKAKELERQTTRLLLVVTFSFLFFMGLHCLIQIIALTQPHAGLSAYNLTSAYAIAKSGYVINSSLNFVLYCMTGKRFRRELKTMLGMEIRKDDLSSITLSSRSSGGTALSSSTTSTSGANSTPPTSQTATY